MEELGSLREAMAAPIESSSPMTPAMPRGVAAPHPPAHAEGEVGRLQKQNFNLKLRLYYLEERLQQAAGSTDGSAATLHEEIFEQRLVISEKSRELEQRNLLLVKARNAIESLQTDVELARAELEQARTSDQSLEVDRLTAVVHNLESRLAEAPDKAEVDAKLARKDAELRRMETIAENLKETAVRASTDTSQFHDMQQEVVRLSTELGEARGRADTLSKQAHEVAQLEADEIASLQQSLASLRQELEAERNMGAQLAKELELKTNMLAETDTAMKALEDDSDALRGQLDALQAELEDTRRTTTDQINAMQLDVQTSKTKELELSVALADHKGQVLALQGSCRTLEERESRVRDTLEDTKLELREAKQAVQLAGASTDIRVQEEREAVGRLQREMESSQNAAKAREMELLQQLQHWEHHLRSTLVDFLREDVATLAPHLARSSDAPEGGPAPPTGRSREAELELLTLLKSLPRIKRWFESAATGYLAEASAANDAALSKLERMAANVASIEDRLRPTIVAASAAITSGQNAERRASMALVERGGMEHELKAAQDAVQEKQDFINALRADLAAATDRLERLQDNNKVLIQELEEKRTVAAMAARDKDILMDDAERLKQQILERDSQLEQHMHRLASHLSGLPPTTTTHVPTEESKVFHSRLEDIVRQTAELVSEASSTTRMLLSSSLSGGDRDTRDVMGSLSSLLHRNQELTHDVQQLAHRVQHVSAGGEPPTPRQASHPSPAPSRTFFTAAALRASSRAPPTSETLYGSVTPVSAPRVESSTRQHRWGSRFATTPATGGDLGPYRVPPSRMSPAVTGPGVSSGVMSGVDRYGARSHPGVARVSGGVEGGASPGALRQQRLNQLQSDMTSRLARIGDDLQETTSRLGAYTTPATK